MRQCLLIADPQPLVQRLGAEFFRQLPGEPGVYLMRDARESILYVGKAKNLRKRLGSYRTANPDRMGRRHLRLLGQVARIEWRLCADEAAALAQEAELLRSIRPKFNRAGVWPVKPQALFWRADESGLHLKIGPANGPMTESMIDVNTAAVEVHWRVIGPMKGARWLRLALGRLLWLATHAEDGIAGLPTGWHQGQMDAEIFIPCARHLPEVATLMQALSGTGVEPLRQWVREKTSLMVAPFELVWLEAELEALELFRFTPAAGVSPTDQVRDEQRMFAFA